VTLSVVSALLFNDICSRLVPPHQNFLKSGLYDFYLLPRITRHLLGLLDTSFGRESAVARLHSPWALILRHVNIAISRGPSSSCTFHLCSPLNSPGGANIFIFATASSARSPRTSPVPAPLFLFLLFLCFLIYDVTSTVLSLLIHLDFLPALMSPFPLPVHLAALVRRCDPILFLTLK